jgi:putative nucleotidyltransferase with HDIG domain
MSTPTSSPQRYNYAHALEHHALYEAFVSLNSPTDAEETLQHELEQEFFENLSVLALTLWAKDQQLYQHCNRVRRIAHFLTQALKLPQAEGITIELAGLFHDIGKIAIHNDLLQKPTCLTSEEFQDVKGHAARGAEILGHIKMLSKVVPMVRHHHERWDGHGYPSGLRCEAIPFGARILAIADAFEVMTSHRAYLTTCTPAQALEELRRCAGTQFDPVLVDRFCSSMEDAFPNKNHLANSGVLFMLD